MKVAIYDRNKKPKHLEIGGQVFGKGHTPSGFSWEDSTLGKGGAFPVYVHHKFLVIDGEMDDPIVYSGSANMSANSVFYNDENLLEITSCPRLARIYLAEFMRLFEHYRARLAHAMKKNDRTNPLNSLPKIAGRRIGTPRAPRQTAASPWQSSDPFHIARTESTASTFVPHKKGKVQPMCPVRFVTYVSGRSHCRNAVALALSTGVSIPRKLPRVVRDFVD